MTRVVCCGLSTLDLRYDVDAPPGPDRKVTARALAIDAGGPALNAARTVVALGGSATLVTAIGSGPVGDLVRAHLRGVAVVDLAPAGWSAPVSTVMVDRAGRRAVVSTNAAGLDTGGLPDTGPALDGDVLLVDGHLAAASLALATAARSRGIPVILDGGSWKQVVPELAPMLTVAALSADFSLPTGDDPLSWFLANGTAVALRTDGAAPVQVRAGTSSWNVPVPPVDAVDTLGAGDVFHGALAFALARRAALPDAVAGACVIAAESVRHRGALGWAGGAGQDTGWSAAAEA